MECLPAQADDTHQQREHEEHVVPFVPFSEIIGEKALVAEAEIVDKRYARNPVSTVGFAVTGHVVLTSCEIPQEIAPVHVVDLVVEEVAHVLRERRCWELCRLQCVAVGIDKHRRFLKRQVAFSQVGPFQIAGRMVWCRAVHAWEQHVGGHHITGVAFEAVVTVGIARGIFHTLFVDGGCRLFHEVVIAGVVDLVEHGRFERRPVEQGCVAVLLAVEVGAE